MCLMAHKAVKGTVLPFLDTEAQKAGKEWFPLTSKQLSGLRRWIGYSKTRWHHLVYTGQVSTEIRRVGSLCCFQSVENRNESCRIWQVIKENKVQISLIPCFLWNVTWTKDIKDVLQMSNITFFTVRRPSCVTGEAGNLTSGLKD